MDEEQCDQRVADIELSEEHQRKDEGDLVY